METGWLRESFKEMNENKRILRFYKKNIPYIMERLIDICKSPETGINIWFSLYMTTSYINSRDINHSVIYIYLL
jgi:hypothetical protein